jgi:uncharacterized protein (DUF1501 family)
MSGIQNVTRSLRRKPCGCPDLRRAHSRRAFLKGALATGAAGLVTQSLSTRFAFAETMLGSNATAEAYTGDVLVILSLRGGFDGLQAVVPAADPDYARWRPNVRIPTSRLIQLDQRFGMHPAMAPLKPLWDAGTFGMVHAVGQAEPNRSHFEAMEEMERAAPGTSTRTGWIDRVLGLRGSGTPFQGMQVGTSLADPSFLGPSPELAIDSIESFGLDAAWDGDELDRWETALRAMHGEAAEVLSAPAATALDALRAIEPVKASGAAPANGASYPDGDLGSALRDTARLIKSRVGLQMASVDYGDWDMHEGMGDTDEGWLHDHLTELSRALAAFAADLGAAMQRVTLVTLTEFGRRVEENGSGGTDHGYGQLVLFLGGGVNGGRVHGTWPGLADDALVDGDLAATTDYRSILAEVLEQRCDAGSLSQVFPGLGSERPGVAKPRT